MKKGITIGIISILFIAGIGSLIWFFMMRRQVPQQAQYIPKNAILVVTLNLRELAIDHIGNEHLFPESANNKSVSKTLDPFIKAIEKNEGAGIKESADVLAFIYREGDAAFLGVVAVLKDSSKFGNLIRQNISKQLSIYPLLAKEMSMVQFDTTSAILAWKDEVALFLFPIGNQNAEATAIQCTKLLSENENASVLSIENFKDHELASFDAGIWMQPEKFLEFTGGGDLFKTVFNNIKYLSLDLDFQDGELVIRRLITAKNLEVASNSQSELKLPCDPKLVMGFYHANLNISNDELLDNFIDAPPLNLLPFNDDRSRLIAKTLNGNFTIFIHDTFSNSMNYITYDYDNNFNRIPISGTKRATLRGLTTSFEVKDKIKLNELLVQWMKEDSIPLNGNTWTFTDSGSPHFLILNDNLLTYSNYQQVDGKQREVPESWAGLNMSIPIGKVILPEINTWASFFIPGLNLEEPYFTENLDNILISEPLQTGIQSSSQIRITMKNKKVNSLMQLEEIFGKVGD